MRTLLPILLSLLLSGCLSSPSPRETSTLQLANPASRHCLAVGGKIDSVKTAAGEEGYCTLPSGERLDEWALYRRDNP
ncbi:putative hemolysin [Pantoea ananatis]|uniref:DUF333 domain-containing protein n=2 Tax=Pantoea ananas TaxID=553 RepID=A0AAJ1CXJ9_PANAN|nr:DUF333 domain-containing protein [Pantoea ananatis]MBN6032453.1 DUF333 domain-containing protein [Pantoea ananatis]MCW0318338.1 hypothetical protein [Pantoea ananatis]MCW0336505.1 hypothetical protein [Pantoea ananatis]MCW0343502.1 hypothetical protein [Pantoea ananatis]MCW0384471.1 hypothetical protein [Pantoea ananatis]